MKQQHTIFFLGEYSLVLLGLITTKFLFFVFDKTDIATWAQYLSVIAIIQPVAILNLADYQVRRCLLHKDDLSNEINLLFRQEAGLRLVISLPLCLIILVCMSLLGALKSDYTAGINLNPCFNLVAFAFIVLSDFALPASIIRSQYKWTDLLIYNLLFSVLKLLCCAIAFFIDIPYLLFILFSSASAFLFSIVMVPGIKFRSLVHRNLIQYLVLRLDSVIAFVAKSSKAIGNSFSLACFSALKGVPLAFTLASTSSSGPDVIIAISILITIAASVSRPFGFIARNFYNNFVLDQNRFPSISHKSSLELSPHHLIRRSGAFLRYSIGSVPLFSLFALSIFIFFCFAPRIILYFLTNGRVSIDNSVSLALFLTLIVMLDHFISIARITLSVVELCYPKILSTHGSTLAFRYIVHLISTSFRTYYPPFVFLCFTSLFLFIAAKHGLAPHVLAYPDMQSLISGILLLCILKLVFLAGMIIACLRYERPLGSDLI